MASNTQKSVYENNNYHIPVGESIVTTCICDIADRGQGGCERCAQRKYFWVLIFLNHSVRIIVGAHHATLRQAMMGGGTAVSRLTQISLLRVYRVGTVGEEGLLMPTITSKHPH